MDSGGTVFHTVGESDGLPSEVTVSSFAENLNRVGEAQLGVYRNGTWYFREGQYGTMIAAAFGNSSDIPLSSPIRHNEAESLEQRFAEGAEKRRSFLSIMANPVVVLKRLLAELTPITSLRFEWKKLVVFVRQAGVGEFSLQAAYPFRLSPSSS